MADHIWTGATSSDWGTAGNWNGGVPTAGNNVYIADQDDAITGVPAAAAGINYALVEVGPNFTGTIADSASPLHVGSVTTINYKGLLCEACYLNVDTGDTVTTLNIDGSAVASNALTLGGPGTVTTALVRAAGMFRISSSAVVTNLNIPEGNPQVFVTSGASLTNANLSGGVVNNEAALTTLNLSQGTWQHQGETTYNITTLNILGGIFRFWSSGGTITTVNLYGGLLDLNGGKGLPRTISTLNRYGGTVDRGGQGSTVTISSYNRLGGTEML